MRHRVVGLGLAGIAAAVMAGALALASPPPPPPEETYKPLSAAPNGTNGVGTAARYRITADATTGTASVNTAVFCHGNPMVVVSPATSVASATYVVTVFFWHVTPGGTETLLAKQSGTATGGAVYTNELSAYPGNPLFFDSLGATKWEVRIEAPSSGWVSYRAWGIGADSR